MRLTPADMTAEMWNVCVKQGTTGVTFAPRQLTSYTTPNFFSGEAASALREANKSRPSSADIVTPGAVTAQTPLPPQTMGTPGAQYTQPQSDSLPSQSPAALPTNSNRNGEPPVKRRAMRKQQPTQKAIEAGLAPALAGHHGQDLDGSTVSSLQPTSHQSLVPHAPVQSAVSLSTAAPAQHLQAGMPVQ